MRFKTGVVVVRAGWLMRGAWEACDEASMGICGKPATCTSVNEGTHKDGSLHDFGPESEWKFAFDLRTRHLTFEEEKKYRDDIIFKLSDSYDVLIEHKTINGKLIRHIHVERDPKPADNPQFA